MIHQNLVGGNQGSQAGQTAISIEHVAESKENDTMSLSIFDLESKDGLWKEENKGQSRGAAGGKAAGASLASAGTAALSQDESAGCSEAPVSRWILVYCVERLLCPSGTSSYVLCLIENECLHMPVYTHCLLTHEQVASGDVQKSLH